jgi:hypothetical protein
MWCGMADEPVVLKPGRFLGVTTIEELQEMRAAANKGLTVVEFLKSRGPAVSLADFYAYMPMHSYIFAPTREMWPAASFNARIPPVRVGKEDIKASLWLDQNNPVEQMTWAPGLPMIIPDRLISEGGWIDRPNVRCFNLYRPATIKLGDASQAGRWLDHIRRVFPDDVDHIVQWLPYRVQHPQHKINHALVLGGLQGIGKDTILEPMPSVPGTSPNRRPHRSWGGSTAS